MSLLGHQLFAAEEGSGEEDVVLLLNGGMMTYAAWAPIRDGLLDRYRVLACDFRGQLRSPGDGHDLLEDNLPDLLDLLDALDLDTVHVLGTSFGGEVSLLFAAHHPERVRTLAAVTAADRTPPGMAESTRELRRLVHQVLDGGDVVPFYEHVVREVYSAAYRQAHAEELSARRQRLPDVWYQGLLGILRSIEDFDLTPSLQSISCPTLVVGAATDIVMPLERVEALASAIPGAELHVHPTAGHVLVTEDPAWLLRTYRAFLDTLPQA